MEQTLFSLVYSLKRGDQQTFRHFFSLLVERKTDILGSSQSDWQLALTLLHSLELYLPQWILLLWLGTAVCSKSGRDRGYYQSMAAAVGPIGWICVAQV